MTIYRGSGGGGNATTDSEIALLTTLEQSASTSAATAAASAAAALASETDAETAELAAEAAQAAAEAAQGFAEAAQTAAEAAQTNAETAESNATASALAASTSEFNAAASELAAGTSETNAAASALAASTSESNAAASASSASTSASNAATSETNAANSASTAASSASNAATSASNAATSESNAAASELLAEDWATKTTGTVDGVEYSAKYYAQQAATFDPADYVNLTDNQTVSGTKTFSSTISGSINGNAATATTATNVDGGTVSATSYNGGQLAGMRNKIINGKMEIAQRGTSFAAIANGAYSLDRYRWLNTSAGVVTASQQADVPTSNEFQSSLRFAVTTADTSTAAGDLAYVYQAVEGYNARDLIGRTFTLSFWVRSSKPGTHCVAFSNGSDRSFVSEYIINSANTWEQKTITVSGGLITAGTWNWTTGAGVFVRFTLAAGTTYQTTAGAWQTGNFLATANQVNCLDTIGNIFAITGVQLEVGSVATPFEHRPYGAELALCQRYYYRAAPGASGKLFSTGGACDSSTVAYGAGAFPVPMRVAPSAVEQSGAASDYRIFHSGASTTLSVVPAYNAATDNLFFAVTGTVTGGLTTGRAANLAANSATAFLGWSAEL